MSCCSHSIFSLRLFTFGPSFPDSCQTDFRFIQQKNVDNRGLVETERRKQILNFIDVSINKQFLNRITIAISERPEKDNLMMAKMR